MANKVQFSSKLVVYVPTYNCEETIIPLLEKIPQEFLINVEFLVVDNKSSDSTVERLLVYCKSTSVRIRVISPMSNIGYAGSQILAYSLICQSKSVEKVIMLHGDGQYSPSLLLNFIPYLESESGSICGYRSKCVFKNTEETPILTWAVIKILSKIESVITGIHLKEWHTGFVMYSTNFLSKVDFSKLTSSPHIDGQLQALASVLLRNNIEFPIYKLYDGYEAFSGLSRIKYIMSVFKLMPIFRKMNVTNGLDIVRHENNQEIITDFEILL